MNGRGAEVMLGKWERMTGIHFAIGDHELFVGYMYRTYDDGGDE